MWTSLSTNFFTYIYRKGEDLIFYAGKEVLLAFVIFFSLVLLYQRSYGHSKQMPSKPGLLSKSRRLQSQNGPHPSISSPAEVSSDDSIVDEPEIIVVGAGILGAAFATVLARHGRRVTVIERDMKEPDTIAGEVLQPGGIQLLKALGIGDSIKGFDAAPIYGYQIFDHLYKTETVMSLPLAENEQLIEGRSFHHGRFVMSLRKLAMAESKVTFIEGTVSRLLEEGDYVTGVQYKDKITGDVKKLHAPLTLVADGIFSNLRKNLISRKPYVTSQFTGVVVEVSPLLQLRKLEAHLLKSRVVVMYPISSTETRMMLDTTGVQPRNIKDFLVQQFYPQIPDHQKEPFLIALQNDNLKTFPTRYLPAVTVDKPGVLILGDAYNLRHPFTAAGMTVILNDIAIWRCLLQTIPDLYDDEAILQAKKQFYWLRKKSFSFVMNVLSEVLYSMFVSKDEAALQLRNAFCCYCNLGEEYALEPTLQIAALSTRPMALIKVLSSVTLYAMYLSFKSEPWYAKPRAVFKSAIILHYTFTKFVPLLYSEIKQHAN